MLIESVLINLLLFDSSNHFLFLAIDVSELGHKFDLFVIVELNESLSLLFFKLSFRSNFVIFHFHLPVVSFSLRSEVVLSSLPKVLLFLLSNNIKSSPLSLNDKLVFLHHNVVVLLFSSLDSLHVW